MFDLVGICELDINIEGFWFWAQCLGLRCFAFAYNVCFRLAFGDWGLEFVWVQELCFGFQGSSAPADDAIKALLYAYRHQVSSPSIRV